MRNLKLTIEYDGTDFFGWQRQPNVRTVQGEIERSLDRILQHPIKLVGSGRTDVGVHALGQVAHFQTSSPISVGQLTKGVNAVLTPDVRVRQVCEVPLDFNARFDARIRHYRYRISKRQQAIGRQYVWYYPRSLDVNAMREASQVLVGEHDFCSFCKADSDVANHVCHVMELQWSENEEEIQLDVKANRFLQKMVRAIMGTAVEVGRGKIAGEEIEHILHARDRRKAGPTVPTRGLCLVHVYY